jgi:protein-tyrosine phosphatase
MEMTVDEGERTFVPHVLVVCYANQIRSPIAEFTLRTHLAEFGVTATVSSAGIRATSGLPVFPRADTYLQRHGIDTAGWRSRQLTAADLAAADIILASERRHLASAAELDATALRRSHLLLGFARFAPHLGPLPRTSREDFRSALDKEIAVARTRIVPGVDDLPDPVGKGRRAMGKTGDRIDTATRAIAAALARVQFV